MKELVEPHGGMLKALLLAQDEAQVLKEKAGGYPAWDLTERQHHDLELLLNGGFSPLEGFLTQADYDSVLDSMRLGDGTLWPIPITLDVGGEFAAEISVGNDIALLDREGVLLAVLRVSDIWAPDKAREAQKVYGTSDTAHAGVNYLFNTAHDVYVGGTLTGIQLPAHYDFKYRRDTPQRLREKFKRKGWHKVIGFHTDKAIHKAEYELLFSTAQQAEASILIHPAVGAVTPGDVEHFSHVKCYEQILEIFPRQTTALNLLPLAPRHAGPREALWHAIIRKNYGCSHFVVEKNHAAPQTATSRVSGNSPHAAQELAASHQQELGVEIIAAQELVYAERKGGYIPLAEVQTDDYPLKLTYAELKRRLREGLDIPDWFSYPEITAELRKSYPPRFKQGYTVFFTGLSGAGKSTIANALMVRLMEMGGRPVTLLDGDIVRKNLSSELSFSKEHRDLNILRIGFVASEITKNGGVAICAPIAPYTQTRREVRGLIDQHGGFIEVHVATPIEICEQRDRKGMYARARAGKIKDFTGVSDPYEEPVNAEVTIDTREYSPHEAAHQIILKLESLGFIK